MEHFNGRKHMVAKVMTDVSQLNKPLTEVFYFGLH